jgi:branched-chain amino acid transport system substrate-binding protein
LAEKQKRLTIAFDCGTSRLFEEQSYRYVFRTNAHQAIDSLAGARYLLDVYPDVSTIAGINQNYSWGQDSWAHFRDTMQKLKPGIQILDEQFPKLGAGDYKAEIASLVQSRPQVIHSSFWGGDLQALVEQGIRGDLFDASTLLFSVGESGLPELKGQIPTGTIVGAHGPHGALAPASPLNDWLVQLYQQRFDQPPTYPVYHMAQAILGVKYAYEEAAAEQKQWPTQEQVIDAFEYSEFPTPSGTILMAIGNGHQAIEPAAYGTVDKYDPATEKVTITNIKIYPADCVNPPDGTTTEQWIKAGFPGSSCLLP